LSRLAAKIGKFIAKVLMEHYKSMKVEPRFMENLQTLIVDTKK